MSLTIWWNNSPPSITGNKLSHRAEGKKRTFEDQEIVLVALEKADQSNDTGVIDPAHDLNLFENICSLLVRPVLIPSRCRGKICT